VAFLLAKFSKNLQNDQVMFFNVFGMDMKKISYLFLAISIAVAGYFIYDTYRIVTSDAEDIIAENVEAGSEGNGGGASVHLQYNEYGIDKDLKYALAEVAEDGASNLYFYDNEVSCESENVFRAIYTDLNLVVSVPSATMEASEGEITSTSLFKRDPAGTYLEISSVPDKKNLIKFDKSDEEVLEAAFEFIWENKRYDGKFNATICPAEVAEGA